MKPTTNESTTRRWTFDHHHLVAFDISKKAMVLGMRISADLPKGYGKLKDQLERALQGAFTQTTEAAARTGQDRRTRFRIARAEAGEAAGILEGLVDLGVTHPARADAVLELLWRLSGLLYRLANPKR
jgi:four helix bundle protein